MLQLSQLHLRIPKSLSRKTEIICQTILLHSAENWANYLYNTQSIFSSFTYGFKLGYQQGKLVSATTNNKSFFECYFNKNKLGPYSRYPLTTLLFSIYIAPHWNQHLKIIVLFRQYQIFYFNMDFQLLMEFTRSTLSITNCRV